MLTGNEIADWMCDELDKIEKKLNHDPLTKEERQNLWQMHDGFKRWLNENCT